MKKVLSILLVAVLLASMSLTAFADVEIQSMPKSNHKIREVVYYDKNPDPSAEEKGFGDYPAVWMLYDDPDEHTNAEVFALQEAASQEEAKNTYLGMDGFCIDGKWYKVIGLWTVNPANDIIDKGNGEKAVFTPLYFGEGDKPQAGDTIQVALYDYDANDSTGGISNLVDVVVPAEGEETNVKVAEEQTVTITVHYVYAEGGQAAPDKNEPCDLFTNYIIPSPKIEGYTPDKSEVNGLASENKEITVTYTKNLPDLSTAVVTGLSSDDTKEYTENEVKNIGLEGLVKGTDYTAAITTDESGTKWIVTMEAVEGKSTGKQTVEVKKAQETVTITVHYVYAEGGTAAPDKNEPCDLFTNYIIPSPKIEGYTPDKSEVNGLASENKEITVTYTKNSVPEPAPVSKDISLDEAKWVGGEGSEALVSLKGTLKGDGWMIGDAYAKIGGAVTSSDCDAIQTGQKGVDTTIKDNGNGTFSFEFKNVLYWLGDKLPTAKSKLTVMMSFLKDGVEYVSNQLTVGMGETAKKAAEAKTTIKVTAAKTKIYVGGSTTVNAKVTNGSGTTAYTTSNKAVAIVDKNGKVTGKGAGTATITAVNNGVKSSVKITVIKKTNTVIASVKGLSVKYKTTKVFKNAISVKNAKGKVTFKKTSGKSQIKVNKKTGKITVKKGLKKGTYKVKVKISDNGNKTYAKASKTITISVTVK